MVKNYVVIGAKWFDKVNGNTYCNAKVIETSTNTWFYIGYQYGYGKQYFCEALKKIREKDPECKGAIDGGCFYIKKADLKNDNF